MTTRAVWTRLRGAYARRVAKWFGRRPFVIADSEQPIISFTFDDFPRSALSIAGTILEQYGVAGTYFVALGLIGETGPTGEIFHSEDLQPLFIRGHEVGCHTFHHYPAWETTPANYEASVDRNAATLVKIAPTAGLQTHSYPINYPRPATKRRIQRRFRACRGGGQAINRGTVDLNYLKSFFLEQSRDDFGAVEQIIHTNAALGGWLVFSTHDVCERPTKFGCQPAFFEKVVRLSIQSGAKILVMSAALDKLGVNPKPRCL
jgi:peptidoglycan/xylan/chitin deacetylase (PgdA/CDA1 family)